jgi:hypothetical protein
MKNNLKESWGGGSSSRAPANRYKAPILNPRTPKKKRKKEKERKATSNQIKPKEKENLRFVKLSQRLSSNFL